jgi:Putative zinc-finger
MNWMHSCKQVAALLSQSMDTSLGWFDRTRLRLHLSMCDNCSNVERQLAEVQLAAHELFDDPSLEAEHEPPR